MIRKKRSYLLLFTFMIGTYLLGAQIYDGVYIANSENMRHQIKVKNGYLILSEYQSTPAKFIRTVGGFFEAENDTLKVSLEFNSNHGNDKMSDWTIPYAVEKDQLILKGETPLVFSHIESMEQELDGAWLFATRGPDEGQERRGEGQPRKTLKFLLDNTFQWIAYNTETMQFFGTGGGFFSSENGIYKEKIAFFSRDNSRVGAELHFEYELAGDDWHHKGKNSKGEPMYEIWSRRDAKN